MVVSLVLDTLEGYQEGEKISFYGESARALWGLCHTGISYEHDENYLGASLVVNSRQFDTISPKAVKKGYRIKIIKGSRI